MLCAYLVGGDEGKLSELKMTDYKIKKIDGISFTV